MIAKKTNLFSSTCVAATGGLLRDEHGEWILGFSQKLSGVTINTAELLALRQGLQLAWDRRSSKIIVETDSEVVYKLVKASDTREHPLHNLLEDVRSLLRRPCESVIQHTKREGNACADSLAKLGHEMDGLCLWEVPPPSLLPFLNKDVEDMVLIA